MSIRHPKESDHLRIISVIKDWWQGRDVTQSVPRLFLNHFKSTSFIAEEDGLMIGFLIGFFSPDHADMGYIHFVGVHPDFQGKGLGKKLYQMFFDACLKHNRNIVQSCTAPINKGSIAFHMHLGFRIISSGHSIENIPVALDYNRPGDTKVLFEKRLNAL